MWSSSVEPRLEDVTEIDLVISADGKQCCVAEAKVPSGLGLNQLQLAEGLSERVLSARVCRCPVVGD
jgi:hypothetical protein